MDYDRAELSFTPRRPITRDSRIVVEFQYTAESYRRSLYFASARIPAGEHFAVRRRTCRKATIPTGPARGAI